MNLRRGRGQALTEFALIAPVLILVLGLTAEVGRSFFIANQLSNATREGALWAGHHYGDTTASTSCSATNATYAEFQANIECVIKNEEANALIGCPPADESFDMRDPATNSPLTSASAPFNTTFPPATPPEYTTQLSIVVHCSIQPLVAIPPIPTTYIVAAKDTTFLLWPPK